MGVRIDEEGLEIDGARVPLVSGAVQYWRLAPEKWAPILDAVVELGFSMIEVYLPWGIHEPRPGEFDFTGRLDAGRFLDLAAERDLKVIARPGPHTNAEVTGFGYPDWVLTDPACQAQGPDGHPAFVPTPPRMFPMPTYSGDALYERCAGYLEQACQVLGPRQHPDGPVVAVQPDNEMAFFFRTATFDVDYCPASVQAYRRFLGLRHHDIAALNAQYGTAYRRFEDVEPPRRFDARTLADLPPYLDWCAYREAYLRDGVLRVAAMLKERGLTRVPMTHNIPLGSLRSPFDLPGLEDSLDLVGIDMYYPRADHRSLRARCLELTGASRYATAPEFASGGYHAWTPIDLIDQRFTSLLAVMHGVRGFNFYMLVDRERWYGGAIRRDGSRDDRRSEFYRHLLPLLESLAPARRMTDAVLLTTRLYGRLIGLHNVLDPLSPMALAGLGLDAPGWVEPRGLGCSTPPAATLAGLHEALFDGLTAARVAFEVGEPDRPAGNLVRYTLAVLPTSVVFEERDAGPLLRFVRAGGTLAMGPEVPRFDAAGREMKAFANALEGDGVPGPAGCSVHALGAGRIVVLPDLLDRDQGELAGLLAEVAAEAGCTLQPDPHDAELMTSIHVDETNGTLWIANPRDEPRVARLSLPDVGALRDRFTGERFGGDETFSIEVKAWAVRPLEVLP